MKKEIILTKPIKSSYLWTFHFTQSFITINFINTTTAWFICACIIWRLIFIPLNKHNFTYQNDLVKAVLLCIIKTFINHTRFFIFFIWLQLRFLLFTRWLQKRGCSFTLFSATVELYLAKWNTIKISIFVDLITWFYICSTICQIKQSWTIITLTEKFNSMAHGTTSNFICYVKFKCMRW